MDLSLATSSSSPSSSSHPSSDSRSASSSGQSREQQPQPHPANSLPDRKTFIATLGGGAFLIGLTGATIYGLRKARAQALKEAQEAAQSVLEASVSAPVSATTSTRAAALARPPAVQPATSPIAALSKNRSRASTSAPNLNATAAAPRSVFDDASNSSLPGVLRRRGTPFAPPTTSGIAPSSDHDSSPSSSSTSSASTSTASLDATTQIDHTEMDSTLDFLGLSTPQTSAEKRAAEQREREQAEHEYRPISFGDTPVGLSLKAFATATLIVLGSSALVVEVTRRSLGVSSIDEFVLRMSRIVPSRSAGAQALGGISPALRTTSDDASSSASSVAGAMPDEARKPLSINEAMDRLGEASSFESWFTTLKTQLDAERDEEVERRFRSLSSLSSTSSSTSHDPRATRQNDSISASYDIHSSSEDGVDASAFASFPILSTLSISPQLPLTGFLFGFVSGLTTAGKRASLVFMAENAHRLPDTVQGWYFYSKTKNYRILLRGLQGGLRQGGRLALWTGGFCVAERLAELGRGWIGEFTEKVRVGEGSGSRYSKRVGAGTAAGDTAPTLQQPQQQPEPSVEVAAANAARSATKFLGHWTDGMVAGLATATVAVSLYRLTRTPAVRVLQLGVLAGGLTGGLRDVQERLVHKEIGGVASHT